MTGKVANFSNYASGFVGGLTIRDMPINVAHPGKVFWVGSAAAQNTLPTRKTPSDGNKGTFLAPFSTIDAGNNACVASRGDIVMVLAGHSETLAAAIALDTAGVAVVGLGYGNNRPQITGGVAADLVAVTAANVSIYGIYFNEKTTASATSATIDIAAAFCTVQNCRFDQGANEVLSVTVTAAGEEPTLKDNVFMVTADGPDNAIQVEGVINYPRFEGNTFISTAATYDDTYAISFEAVAVTNAVLVDNLAIGTTQVLGGNSASTGTVLESSGVTVQSRVAVKHGFTFDEAEHPIAEVDAGDVLIVGAVLSVQGGAETGVEAVFDNLDSTSAGTLYTAAQEVVIEVGDGLAVGEQLVLGGDSAVDAAEADHGPVASLNWLVGAGDNIVWDAAGASTADGVGHLALTYISLGGDLEIE